MLHHQSRRTSMLGGREGAYLRFRPCNTSHCSLSFLRNACTSCDTMIIACAKVFEGSHTSSIAAVRTYLARRVAGVFASAYACAIFYVPLQTHERSSGANLSCQNARKWCLFPVSAISSTSLGFKLNVKVRRMSRILSSFELVVIGTTPWSTHQRSRISPGLTAYFLARDSSTGSKGPPLALTTGTRGAYAATLISLALWYARRSPCWR